MTKQRTPPTLHTATLTDRLGDRHIATDAGPAYCGVDVGALEKARAHEVDALCQRCRDARGRALLEQGTRRMGL